MISIAVRHDLRGQFGPARDQGARETCLSFATSDDHAAVLGAPWTELCCEYLFYHAKQRDLLPADRGTTMSAIAAALELDGQPVETDWPYLASLPADLGNWKPPTTIGPLFHQTMKLHGNSFIEVWDSIEADVPAIVGMTLSTAFFTPKIGGLVDANEPVDPNIRHAVLAVGTGTLSKDRLVLVRNSWGASWGSSGYAWVSKEYMTPRILQATTLG